MKIKETISEPASFFKKEVRRILINDVTKRDLPELSFALNTLFLPGRRRQCILWLAIVGARDYWIKNEEEAQFLANGFFIAMTFVDPSFQEKIEALPAEKRELYGRPDGFLENP